MEYQKPYLLYALLAIAVPIIIHLLNIRRHKRINFSSLRFLKEIKNKKNRISKIKNLLLLICRTLAISFLIIAFAKPFIPNSKYKNSSSIYIYIDNSFSMDANDGNGRLLDIAKEKARLIINSYTNECDFYLLTNDLNSHNTILSKASISERIYNITSSGKIQNISNIINNIKKDISENSHVYLISDLQKETFNIDDLKINSSFTTYIIPVNVGNMTNISIDSCWIDNVSINNINTDLFANITNHSNQKLEDIVIFLEINGKKISQQYLNLEKNTSKKISFNFRNEIRQEIEGKIFIDDSPITFDNKLFFTINKKKRIEILSINKENPNTNLNSIYTQDTNIFNYKNTNINNINYDLASKQDLLILNEIYNITSGLTNVVNKVLSTGSNILVVPPKNINISEYNYFLDKLSLNKYNGLKNNTIKINKIEVEHPLYKNVFNGDMENISYPQTKNYYSQDKNIIYTPLMSLENNEPFLSVYNKQNGLIYIFNAPLAEKVNDFTEHELFVPTLINIATINSNQEKLYYVIDRDKYISNKYSTYTNQIFNLKNVNIDLIPPFKHLNGKTYFNTQNMIRNDGVYLLTNANDTIKKFSFNYDRNESKIISFNSDEIQKKIISNKLLNTNLISANIESFKNKLNSERNNKELWKCSLLLSMLFFAIEILIIKFIKI